MARWLPNPNASRSFILAQYVVATMGSHEAKESDVMAFFQRMGSMLIARVRNMLGIWHLLKGLKHTDIGSSETVDAGSDMIKAPLVC